MPISVSDLIEISGLSPNRIKTSKWGKELQSSSIGIYIISTSRNPNKIEPLFDVAPIGDEIIKFWINKVKTIQVDNRVNPKVEELKTRLSEFWLPDENILYIGKTESKKGLKGRVNQFYITEIGDSKPHAGGHWLKTLTILNELYIHYISCRNPESTEKIIMDNFTKQVSKETKVKLRDKNLPLPFANLEKERGNIKKHGISKSKLD